MMRRALRASAAAVAVLMTAGPVLAETADATGRGDPEAAVTDHHGRHDDDRDHRDEDHHDRDHGRHDDDRDHGDEDHHDRDHGRHDDDRDHRDKDHASGVVGHVYVNNNTRGVNTIGAFDRHADGTLKPMPGSPFLAGGAGTGTGLASQGALQRSSDGRYLLAVDAGSNQVSVLRIKPDGFLKPVGGGPVSSNGVNPVSIAVHDDLVYVANAGTTSSTGGTNYTGFRLNRGGHLRPLAGSTIALPDGSQPGDVLFSPDGSKLAGTRVETSLIDSFTVGRDGLLTAAPGSPFPAQDLGPFGSKFRPTDAGQLFVTNAHNPAPNSGTVSAFSVAADGALTSIGSSPFPNDQTAPCWVEISRDGQFLFAVNTASGSISSYSIAPGGSLTLLQNTPVRAAVSPEDARLSPDGSTLWVVDPGANAVSGFAVNGGSLTELPTSPTPGSVGAAPSGIVVT